MKLQQVAPTHLRRIVGAVSAWPVASQQQARRNALVASTALTARRAEQLEVEDFLARQGAAVGPRETGRAGRSA